MQTSPINLSSNISTKVKVRVKDVATVAEASVFSLVSECRPMKTLCLAAVQVQVIKMSEKPSVILADLNFSAPNKIRSQVWFLVSVYILYLQTHKSVTQINRLT